MPRTTEEEVGELGEECSQMAQVLPSALLISGSRTMKG